MNLLQMGVLLMASATTQVDELAADGWSRFRGPGGHGVSDATTLPDRITDADVNWRIKLPGGGHSSPVVWGDSIYLTWVDEQRGVRSIGCVSATDGSIRWTFDDDFDPYEHHRDNSFASSSPTVDAHGVYCYWSSGDRQLVAAVSHAGERRWAKTLGSWGAEWGTGSSPIIADGVLIIANDNERHEGFLAGLDPATGEEIWRRKRAVDRSSYATPMVMEVPESGAQVVFASTAHGLTCLAARDGRLIWEIDGLFEQRCVGSPVLAGDLIYQFAGSSTSGKEACAITPPAAGESATPQVHHRLSGGLPYVPTPIAFGPWIFLWTDSGILSCVRAADGEVIWKERIGGRFYGSPVCMNGRLYCMSRDGQLYVVQADDEYNLLYTYEMGEGSSATPAVADDALLLRTERHLMSIGGRDSDQH